MSAAAFHRAVALDTRISVAVAELRVGSRIDRTLAARLGIDLAPAIATLEAHLEALRAELRRMMPSPYPQQPGAVDDVLTERVTPDEVDQHLVDAGGDPVAIGHRGATLVKRLLATRVADVDLQRWADDGGAPC